jgi:hypothetical protein
MSLSFYHKQRYKMIKTNQNKFRALFIRCCFTKKEILSLSTKISKDKQIEEHEKYFSNPFHHSPLCGFL